MAANINPQASATTVGRAVPLTFALAAVGILLVSYTFVRLCQRFHHSGSVYGFVGATLGARTGVISGWALTGTYTFYGVVTSGRLVAGDDSDPPRDAGRACGRGTHRAVDPCRDGHRHVQTHHPHRTRRPGRGLVGLHYPQENRDLDAPRKDIPRATSVWRSSAAATS
ncbi:MAG TPA: hypothetical protein VFW09_06835 [Solirubrobacteraceae bacterium]|nr:hypothetical protein [Solirubrobacteraceae bacterium]